MLKVSAFVEKQPCFLHVDGMHCFCFPSLFLSVMEWRKNKDNVMKRMKQSLFNNVLTQTSCQGAIAKQRFINKTSPNEKTFISEYLVRYPSSVLALVSSLLGDLAGLVLANLVINGDVCFQEGSM